MDYLETNSQSSFDSSIKLPSLDGTQSTVSLPQIDKDQTKLINKEANDLDMDSLTPEKTRATCFANFNEMDGFVGFQNGFGGKKIEINKSKLKRAQIFFDDNEEIQTNIYFSNPFFDLKSKRKSSNLYFKQQEQLQLSMPCFKSGLNGIEVKISKQAELKAKLFFGQSDSFKKPTKMKQSKLIHDESLLKTVNQSSNTNNNLNADFCRPQNKKLLVAKNSGFIQGVNRKSFNWQEYEKEYKEELRNRPSFKICSKRKKNEHISPTTQKKNTAFLNNFYEFEFYKLKDLTISTKQQIASSRQLQVDSKSISSKTFSHLKSQCKILKCVLCSINFNKNNFGFSQLYEVMNKQFAKKWVSLQEFQPLYEEVCFKLLKYQHFWPQILNKRCQPNNLIVQINKKLLKLCGDTQCSFLKKCLTQEQIGRKIHVIVKEKIVNCKMEIVFLKLSDGWYSVWSAIESDNLLYNYLINQDKVRVGTKLCLSLWNMHPISNICRFCPNAKVGDVFIEFHYNGAIILQPNAVLGYTKEQFYRPLNKCRYKGGVIPVVEGIVIRMFSLKQKNKKSGQFSHHFSEILTPEGIVCLIQFVLGQQNSLVQYFRLYRSYMFFRLKITEDKLLSFSMEGSKFEQIKSQKISQKQLIFPQRVLNLLRNRWICNKSVGDLIQGKNYDLITNKGMVKLADKQYAIKIENESAQMNFTTLYQQYQFLGRSDDELHFAKKKWSSQLRRLPAIYNKLMSEL